MHEQIKHELIRAYLRFEQEPQITFDDMVNMMIQDYKGMSAASVIAAIKSGATGEYGHFNRINLHTVGVWIRCHAEQCKPNDLKSKRERL